MELERLCKISIGKNRQCGAQMLQVIKRLLAPIVPGDGCLLLACIFTRCQFVQGSGYLCELGDELKVVTCEPKETLDLSDSGWGRPFSNSIYFAFICHYSLGQDNVAKVCNLPMEKLIFRGIKFQPGLLPVSRTWPPASQDGWLDLLKKMTISSK